jgi:hypothetical protein
MLLEIEDFVKDSRLCPPLQLEYEDRPQDIRDWNKLVKEHQERLYDHYLAQFEPKELPSPEIVQHQPMEKWAKKHNVTLPVTKQLTELRNNGKSRAEYMRGYRRKPKFCPHCKKQL